MCGRRDLFKWPRKPWRKPGYFFHAETKMRKATEPTKRAYAEAARFCTTAAQSMFRDTEATVPTYRYIRCIDDWTYFLDQQHCIEISAKWRTWIGSLSWRSALCPFPRHLLSPPLPPKYPPRGMLSTPIFVLLYLHWKNKSVETIHLKRIV